MYRANSNEELTAGAPSETLDLLVAHLETRLRRFDVLRGAGRAIASSLPNALDESLESEALTLALREPLEQVPSCDDPREQPTEQSQRSVLEWTRLADTLLRDRSRALRERIDGISLSQLRATLPDIARSRRFDVLALLDVIVRDEPGLVLRADLFDYLITLLAPDVGAKRDRSRKYGEKETDAVIRTLTEACASEPLEVAALLGRVRSGMGERVEERLQEPTPSPDYDSVVDAIGSLIEGAAESEAEESRERQSMAARDSGLPSDPVCESTTPSKKVAQDSPAPESWEVHADESRTISRPVRPETAIGRAFRRHRKGSLAVASIVIAAVAMTNLRRVEPSAIQHLSPNQVTRISPYLASTYWDPASEGGLFVATLVSGWDRIPAAKRFDHAGLIVRRLSDVRPSSIQVSDESGRTRIKAEQGRLLLPTSPDDA